MFISNSERVWTDSKVPSLKDLFAPYFEYFGLCTDSKRLILLRDGITKHASSVTMENEFKPQFLFRWFSQKPVLDGTFTSSAGVTISVPKMNGLVHIADILELCRQYGLKMQGHTLIWHAQTDEAFFHQNYDIEGPLAGKEEMTAREEWYIKSVITFVQNWENKNNDGKHIVYQWDVINDPFDDQGKDLRKNSRWYDIFGNDLFIINAFAFANKYAAPDVKLCFNGSEDHKRDLTCRMVKKILEHNKGPLPCRLDIIGIHSHLYTNYNLENYKKSLEAFLELGIDLAVTELDVATLNGIPYRVKKTAAFYKKYFSMILNYAKKDERPGISSVTFWGINDEATWLNLKFMGMEKAQFPLLFKRDEENLVVTKPTFWALVEAVNKFSKSKKTALFSYVY